MTYQPLTDEQAAALEAFAEARSADLRGWRTLLNDCWLKASYPDGTLYPHALQQVRNAYGSTWLNEVYGWHWTPVLPRWQAMNGRSSDFPIPDAGAKWSADFPPPPVGGRVNVRINGLGPATVTGYFVESGYLGVIVKLDDPKPFYLKQNGGNVPGHSFGAEIDLLPAPAPAG